MVGNGVGTAKARAHKKSASAGTSKQQTLNWEQLANDAFASIIGVDAELDHPWMIFSLRLVSELSDLQQTNATLVARIEKLEERQVAATAAQSIPAAVNKQLQAFDAAIAKLNQHMAAVEEGAKSQQAAIEQQSNATKSYAAAVAASAAPKREPYKTFRVTMHGDGNKLPDTTQEAYNLAKKVLNEIASDVRAASVTLQRSTHGAGPVKAKPTALVISLLPVDACTVKPLLWDKAVQDRLHAAGWRVSTHLPADEFKAKQALWALHGVQMRAWVDAGKPLIYGDRHQSVSVEGAQVLKLPQMHAVART